MIVRDSIVENISINDINGIIGETDIAMLIGRFQPLSIKHLEMMTSTNLPLRLFVIESSNYDPVRSPFSFDLRTRIIEDALMYEKIKNFQVISVFNGFIGNCVNYLRDEDEEPLIFLCGGDRFDSYERQFKDYGNKLNLSTMISTYERIDDTISSTLIRESLEDDDYELFQELTHCSTWKYYTELRKEIGYYKF